MAQVDSLNTTGIQPSMNSTGVRGQNRKLQTDMHVIFLISFIQLCQGTVNVFGSEKDDIYMLRKYVEMGCQSCNISLLTPRDKRTCIGNS